MYEELKNSVEKLKLPDNDKKRIIKNCYLQISANEKTSIKNNQFKKILPLVAAAMVLAILSYGAIANHLGGFKNVKKGTAIVGTIYNETTEMIEIIAEANENLIVYVNVLDYTKPPYCEIDTLNIGSYSITDNSGNTVVCENTKTSEFKNGKAVFEIPLKNVVSGKYKLRINEFTGLKKADQPLPIKGIWECNFIK